MRIRNLTLYVIYGFYFSFYFLVNTLNKTKLLQGLKMFYELRPLYLNYIIFTDNKIYLCIHAIINLRWTHTYQKYTSRTKGNNIF